jgi:hypothetical protein
MAGRTSAHSGTQRRIADNQWTSLLMLVNKINKQNEARALKTLKR